MASPSRSTLRGAYHALAAAPDLTSRLAARAFGALGRIGVQPATVELVASEIGESDTELVRAALDLLVDEQLLEPVAADEYRQPELVRLLAAEVGRQPVRNG